MSEAILLLENVEAVRGDAFTLHIRHFALRPGERVAVVGRSGSGKSTCLDVMAGVLRPSRAERFEFRAPEGAVSLAELWARRDQAGLRRLRARRMGYVLQTGGLVPFLSLERNVALPLILLGRREPERVAELLGSLGLAGLGHRKPRQVSIGQRQRAALARALAARPAILFADEPTASLDPATADAVTLLLRDASEREAAGIIMVTHDRELAQRLGFRLAECAPGEQPGTSVLDDRQPC